MTRTRTEVTAYAGIASSVLAAVLVLSAPTPWLGLIGALLLACVPAGAAVMCWIDTGENAAQAGLTLVLSLTVLALLSAIMIWLAAWQPQALLVLAGAALISCALRLRVDAGGWRGTMSAVQHALRFTPFTRGDSLIRRISPQIALPVVGLGAWAFGVSQLQPSSVGGYGLLASSNVFFVLGLVALMVGFVLELARPAPRGWLLTLDLIGLVVAIHATVPIVYGGTPEYAWVYKHLGIISSFAHAGRITDPGNIYDQWPALFAAVAGISSLAHVNAVSFAAWAPLAFELADTLLLLAIFRMLTRDRRVPYLAVGLYVGLIAWVGQDYLSPQAFAYLLWLAMLVVILRWLRAPTHEPSGDGRIARWRAALVAGMAPAPNTTRTQRALAVGMVIAIYFVIVAAHQLTPYVIIAGVGALTLTGLVRPRWLLLALVAVAAGYLAPHYSLISHNFGGLFSGGNPIQNASGARGTYHAGGEALTAQIVRVLAAGMWLLALAAVLLRRKSLGRVLIPALLAFSPFVILGAQSYGGEAIYRVYLFSAPWCALLIAGGLLGLRLPRRLPIRWPLIAIACVVALFAGLQGLYGPTSVNAFTPSELTASQWLYAHAPRGSLFVLPGDNFPALQTADYNSYDVQVMPSDPQLGESWLNEGNLPEVKRWIGGLGHHDAYVVLSRSMSADAAYFGAPLGYDKLVSEIPTALGGSVVYRNADATIYRLTAD